MKSDSVRTMSRCASAIQYDQNRWARLLAERPMLGRTFRPDSKSGAARLLCSSHEDYNPETASAQSATCETDARASSKRCPLVLSIQYSRLLILHSYHRRSNCDTLPRAVSK